MKIKLPVDCILNIYQPWYFGADKRHRSTDGLHHLATVKFSKFLLDSVVNVIPTDHFEESDGLTGVSIRNLSCKF